MKSVNYLQQQKIERKKRFMWKALLISSGSAIGLAGIVYFLFFSNVLAVRDIKISGNQSLTSDELSASVWNWLGHKTFFHPRSSNIFFASTNDLAEVIRENPKVASVEIKKKYWHSLEIFINERNFEGIICTRGETQCMYFDKNGVLYEYAPQTTGFLILNIIDERIDNLKIGGSVDNKWLVAVERAYKKLQGKAIKLNKVVIPQNTFDEFYVQTGQDWRIIFSIKGNIEKQIDSMTEFLKTRLTPEKITSLEYIDLRIDDRIYYK